MGLLDGGKRLGALIVDEKGRRFKISGYAGKKPKSGLVGTMVKGTLALATMGASLLIDRGKKVTTGWMPFEKLIGFDVRSESATEKNTVGAGAVIGRIGIGKSESVSKKVTLSSEIVVQFDSLDNPVVVIPIVEKPLKSKKDIQEAQRYQDESLAALSYIKRNQQDYINV